MSWESEHRGLHYALKEQRKRDVAIAKRNSTKKKKTTKKKK